MAALQKHNQAAKSKTDSFAEKGYVSEINVTFEILPTPFLA